MEMGADTEHSDLKKDKEGQGNIIQCRETRDIRKRPELEPENCRGESHCEWKGKNSPGGQKGDLSGGTTEANSGRVKQQLNQHIMDHLILLVQIWKLGVKASMLEGIHRS